MATLFTYIHTFQLHIGFPFLFMPNLQPSCTFTLCTFCAAPFFPDLYFMLYFQ